MKKINAFTLVEILVVATIIGLLSIGGFVSYSRFGAQSRDARRKADIEQVRAALEMYKSNDTNSSYSLTIDALVTANYLKSKPVDPKSDTDYPLTYNPLPGGCNGTSIPCTNYIVNKTLESGEVYQVDPYGGIVVTLTPTPGT